MATAAGHRGTPLSVRGSRCLSTHLPFACEHPRFPRFSSSMMRAKCQECQPEEHTLCCHPVEPRASIRPLFTQPLVGWLQGARALLCGDREVGGARGACGPQDRGCCAWESVARATRPRRRRWLFSISFCSPRSLAFGSLTRLFRDFPTSLRE